MPAHGVSFRHLQAGKVAVQETVHRVHQVRFFEVLQSVKQGDELVSTSSGGVVELLVCTHDDCREKAGQGDHPRTLNQPNKFHANDK